MSIEPIITFKAGLCELDTNTTPPKVKALPTPGYIYLYAEEDLIHFCWRPRSAPLDASELDLLMLPTDGSFKPYQPSNVSKARPTNGRIYVLKFSSSPQRHLFWLQSQSQHPHADPSWFSPRDLKLGQIVDNLLQGEDVDVQQAIAELPADQNDPDGDDDATMEDAEGTIQDPEHHRGGSGGAGPDATGGDVREEGEQSREGGADGGRAALDDTSMDASAIVQKFLQSMGGAQQSQASRAQGPPEKLFTTLADLLTPTSTIPWIESASEETVDHLLTYLPPALVSLAQQAADDDLTISSLTAESVSASVQALSLEQKKTILQRVLRSPQFSQSLSSLTTALRDGGLPTISEALNIPVRNGGYMRRGGVPLGGGEAVEVFLDGVKDTVSKEDGKDEEYDGGGEMDTK